jgi:hypothetical protein
MSVKSNPPSRLAELLVLARSGLERANAELIRADQEDDAENWWLWRGYRKAILEVLAVLERGGDTGEPVAPH